NRARFLGRGADQRALDVLEHPAGAELEYEVALGLAGLLDRVDHHDVARLRRPSFDRSEIGNALPQRFDLPVDELGRNLGFLVGNLEARPKRDLWLRLHRDRWREDPLVALR